MEQIYCIVTEFGDPRVGIFERTFMVPTPFIKDELDRYSQEKLDEFKICLFDAYNPVLNGNCSVRYDYE